jgi:uncharacterized protein YbjQ (UPF0145 family)
MKAFVAILAAATLAGCVTLRAEHVVTGSVSPAFTGVVKIVMEGVPVAGEYEEVAIVTATGGALDAALPTVIAALQKEAAALGCNAVIRVRFDRGSEAATATGVAVRMK